MGFGVGVWEGGGGERSEPLKGFGVGVCEGGRGVVIRRGGGDTRMAATT